MKIQKFTFIQTAGELYIQRYKAFRMGGWKVALGISNPEVNVRFLGGSFLNESTELGWERAQEVCS